MFYEVGADELSDSELAQLASMGISGFDLIGAARPRIVRRATPARAPVPAPRQGQTVGQMLAVGDQRKRAMGLGRETGVAAGASTTLSAKCEKALQPDKLVISSSSLADWLVTDLKVGVASQFSSTDSMPAEAFRVDATGFIECDPVRVGQDVYLSLTNTSAGALAVSAVLLGPAAQ
jgi:hypothetical protein